MENIHNNSSDYIFFLYCFSFVVFLTIVLFPPPQIHGSCHADAVQHSLQLQETDHSHDLRGVGAVLRHIVSPVVWPK